MGTSDYTVEICNGCLLSSSTLGRCNLCGLGDQNFKFYNFDQFCSKLLNDENFLNGRFKPNRKDSLDSVSERCSLTASDCAVNENYTSRKSTSLHNIASVFKKINQAKFMKISTTSLEQTDITYDNRIDPKIKLRRRVSSSSELTKEFSSQ